MIPKLKSERLTLREIKNTDIFGYYEIFSDSETMKLFGGHVLRNDIGNKDFIQQMKSERENGILFLWTITFKEEKEFIGFVRLRSYNSYFYDISFSSMGEHRFDDEFLEYFDRDNGWEIDYALVKRHRNKGLMLEALREVIKFCRASNISPIYAKVNSIANSASIKVLRNCDFREHVPLINPKLLKTNELQKTFEKGLNGMALKWTF
jgi:RimJ/RimL family protein N-acetyltransferase